MSFLFSSRFLEISGKIFPYGKLKHFPRKNEREEREEREETEESLQLGAAALALEKKRERGERERERERRLKTEE